jgi:hypothetical protein
VRTPPPPGDPNVLTREFPTLTWPAQQPLSRVHRVEHDTAYFATGQDGRFNPPLPEAGFGTLYLSSHPRGAFVETLGRFRYISQAMINERVLAEVLTAASDDDDGVTFGDDVKSPRVHVRAGLRVVMLSRSSSCCRGLAGMAAPPLCALSRCVPVREAGRGRSLR